MDTNEPYYGTQGGGMAIKKNGQLVWETPPSWLDEARPGDPIPEEWSVSGPFDRTTNKGSR